MSPNRRDFVKASAAAAAATALGPDLLRAAPTIIRPAPTETAAEDFALEAIGAARDGGAQYADARVGRVVDIEVEASDPASARKEVERMCDQLLANPLIESYEIEIAAGE